MNITIMHPMTSGVPKLSQGQFSPDMNKIPIQSIKYRGDRERELNESTVKKIYESIDQHGLISPIGVIRTGMGDGYFLIFGAHRLEAWRRRLEESPEDDKRWFYISCLVYPDNMTEDNAKLLELRENLERAELTKAQRSQHIAKVLELLNPKSRKSEKVGDSKKSEPTFKVPTQKSVIELLSMKPTTFKDKFKAYQQDSGISANWTKLTEEQYNGFIQWFRDQADSAEAEAKTKAEKDTGTKAKAEHDAAAKAWQKAFDAVEKAANAAIPHLGGKVALDLIALGEKLEGVSND